MEKNLLTAKAVFDHANEIGSPTERRAYLDQACADDAALREKVEGLLKAYEDAGSLFEPAQAPARATVDQRVAEGPGSCIGRYKLLQQLGEGGMGIVHMAEQQEPVRRRVALKIIKPGMDTAQVIARFEAERQALAMMDHHNIARVLDAGATESGRPYFVMELVHGVPITKYCDDNQLTLRERLELLVPVCQAVQHAHQKGVIHRDIKPSNVMVCLYDGKPVPKVIDFGVAKATEQRLTERTLFTQYGAIVGTFEYMSPEQAEMSQLGVDTRSDIYSLGVLLYELLTGDTPLSRQRLREAAFDEVLRLIRTEDPPRPSTRLSSTWSAERRARSAEGAASHGKSASRAALRALRFYELDWIVMKALEKDRTRRYDSASGLAKDLERYLRDEPVEACPPSPMYRLRKFARRHKTGVVTTLAIVFATIVSVIFQAINLVRAREAEAAAQALALEKQQAADEAAKALVQARRAKNDAELATDQLQRSLYFSRIHLAQRELAANNIGRARDLLDKCPAELRQWEWHYLNRLSHAELLNLQHPAEIWNVAFSPDGQRLVSSCGVENAPSEVKVWDANTGKELLTLSRHGKPVTCTAFSPDGKFLAWTGAATKFVKIVDTSTGKEAKTWSLPGVAVQIAFSPDGKSLATALGYLRGRLMLWNTSTGQEIPTPLLQMRVVGPIAFAPDGKQLAIVTAPDNHLKLYDLSSGAARKIASTDHLGFIARVAFSSDGQRLAGAGDQRISIWDVKTGEEIQHIVPQSTILNAAFSQDGQRLAFATADHSIQVWGSTQGQKYLVRLVTLRGHSGLIGVRRTSPLPRLLAFSPDGSRLASGSFDRTVKIWDVTQNPETRVLREALLPLSVAFSNDGRHLALSKMEEVLVLDPKTGAQKQSFGSSLSTYWSAAFSPDNKHLAAVTGYPDYLPPVDQAILAGRISVALKIWDLDTGKETFAFSGKFGVAPRLAYGPERNSPRLAVAGGGLLRIWDTATHKLLHALPNSTGLGKRGSVAFSSDGRLVAAGGADEVKLWDPETGKLVHTLRGHGQISSCLAFQPRSARLAAGSHDRQVRIWDADNGTLLHNLGPHPHPVRALAYSPDGRRLAVAGGDTVKLWDADTGDEVLTLPLPRTESILTGVTFSPDGRQIVATDMVGQAVVAWEAGR